MGHFHPFRTANWAFDAGAPAHRTDCAFGGPGAGAFDASAGAKLLQRGCKKCHKLCHLNGGGYGNVWGHDDKPQIFMGIRFSDKNFVICQGLIFTRSFEHYQVIGCIWMMARCPSLHRLSLGY